MELKARSIPRDEGCKVLTAHWERSREQARCGRRSEAEERERQTAPEGWTVPSLSSETRKREKTQNAAPKGRHPDKRDQESTHVLATNSPPSMKWANPVPSRQITDSSRRILETRKPAYLLRKLNMSIKPPTNTPGPKALTQNPSKRGMEKEHRSPRRSQETGAAPPASPAARPAETPHLHQTWRL